jgi:hypothetical protein
MSGAVRCALGDKNRGEYILIHGALLTTDN